MAAKTTKKSSSIESTLRTVKEIVEIIRHRLDWVETRQRSMGNNVDFMREQLSVVNEKLDSHTKKLDAHTETLQTHTEKLDALLVDVNELNDDSKANWDKITIVDEKHTRAIKEIRQHVGLTS